MDHLQTPLWTKVLWAKMCFTKTQLSTCLEHSPSINTAVDNILRQICPEGFSNRLSPCPLICCCPDLEILREGWQLRAHTDPFLLLDSGLFTHCTLMTQTTLQGVSWGLEPRQSARQKQLRGQQGQSSSLLVFIVAIYFLIYWLFPSFIKKKKMDGKGIVVSSRVLIKVNSLWPRWKPLDVTKAGRTEPGPEVCWTSPNQPRRRTTEVKPARVLLGRSQLFHLKM